MIGYNLFRNLRHLSSLPLQLNVGAKRSQSSASKASQKTRVRAESETMRKAKAAGRRAHAR